jgi:hypothetical protein
MSLINDALKRAADAHKRHGDLPPGSPLQPVDYAGRPTPLVRFLALLLILSLIGVAGFFFVKWNQALEEQEASTSAMIHMVESRRPNPAPSPAAPAPLPSVVEAEPTPPQAPTNRPSVRVSTNLLVRTNWVSAAPAPTEDAPDKSTVAEPSAVPSPAPPATPPQTNAVVAEAGAATNAAPATLEPRLRLQSIIYRLKNPTAVINGEMVGVGDQIKDGRVLRIDRYSVTVEWKGETNQLTLPRL